jgi:hypothetical protein
MFVSIALLCSWIKSKNLTIKHDVTITFTGDTLPIEIESNVEPFLSIFATRPYIEITELENIEEP